MRIENTKPPIWEEAHKHFEIDDSETFYTYGEILHNPAGINVTDDIIVHESKHSLQQTTIEGGPAEWWRRYFSDKRFRKEQELEAYAAQYAFFCKHKKDGNDRIRYLHQLASLMASPMYKVEIGQFEALRIIRDKANAKRK